MPIEDTPQAPESDPNERRDPIEADTQSASVGRMKGGHDPRELARRSAEVRRERKQAEQGDDSDGAIVRSLRRKAAKGDAVAARELREWLDRGADPLARRDVLSVLTREQRAIIRSWIEEKPAS